MIRQISSRILCCALFVAVPACDETLDKSAALKKNNTDISTSFSVVEETSQEGNGEEGFQVILGKSMLTIPAGSVSPQVKLKATIKRISSDDSVILSGTQDAYAVEITDLDTHEPFAVSSILKPFTITTEMDGTSSDKNDLMIRNYDGSGSYYSAEDVNSAQFSLTDSSVIQFQIPVHAPTSFAFWFGDAASQSTGMEKSVFASLESDDDESSILKKARQSLATATLASTTATTVKSQDSGAPVDGLQLHLKFEETQSGTVNSSSDFADSSPKGFHASVFTQSSGAVQFGRLGKKGRGVEMVDYAMQRSKRIQIPDNNALSMAGEGQSLTVLLWLKLPMGFAGQSVVMDKRLPNDPYRGFHMFIDDGSLYFQVNDSSWLNRGPYSSQLNDGNWHHVSLVWNATNKVARIEVDGNWVTPSEGVSIQGISTLDNTSPLEIGGRCHLEFGAFVGTMDEFAIFNRALALDEINAFAN